jgi:hypothetical protein
MTDDAVPLADFADQQRPAETNTDDSAENPDSTTDFDPDAVTEADPADFADQHRDVPVPDDDELRP